MLLEEKKKLKMKLVCDINLFIILVRYMSVNVENRMNKMTVKTKKREF